MSIAERRTLIGWMAANPIFLLTILTAAFYAAIRFGQKTFYSRLGLTPEDVGLNRVDTLTQATGLALDVLFVLAVMVGLPLLAYLLYRRGEERWATRLASFLESRGRTLDPSAQFPSRFANAMWFAALFVIAAFTVFFSVVWFWQQANWAANRVEAGKPVRLGFLSDTGIHAEMARIAWIGDGPQGLTHLSTHSLMYMGQSSGAVIVYDVDDKRSIRIPSGDIAVSILPEAARH